MLLMSTAQTTRRAPRGSLLVLGLLLVLWLAWLAWWLLAPERNPDGQCEGLGFGCTLTPRSLAEFAAVIALAPLTALVLAVTAAVRAVRVGRGSPRSAWDFLVGALLVAAFLAWLVGTVAGSL
jgi:hypothetical protein